MSSIVVQETSAKSRAKPDRVKALTELESEVIGLFVQLSRAIGWLRSLAESLPAEEQARANGRIALRSSRRFWVNNRA